MNYYQARELKKGGWHFTCMNDNKVWPVGFCTEHEPHKTREEAEACYRLYLIDNANFKVKLTEVTRCSFCRNLTRNAVDIDRHIMPLCRNHHNKESLQKKYEMATAIASSY